MKGKPTTRRERVEAREEAILAAAHAVFAERGFDGAKMVEIARRARVAEGTLYLYFKNKNALLEGVIAAFYARLTAGAERGVEGYADTFERLEFLARHHLDECLAEWRLLELMIGLYRQLPEYRNRGYFKLNKAYVTVFDRVVREGIHRGELRDSVPPWLLRDLFYGTLEYAARTLKLHGREHQDRQRVVDELLEILRAGTAVRVAAAPAPAELGRIARRLERIAERLERRGVTATG